jgi:FtsH-binding integral membrane protein
MNLPALTPSTQKLLIGGVLFGAWSYLVYVGKTDASSFVDYIKDGLIGLGLYHTLKPSQPTPPAQ